MANLTLRSTTSATDPGSTSAKGSALTHTEADSNFILLNTDIQTRLTDVASDTTPQLGGDLDVNGQKITSASSGNIVLDPNGSGTIQLNSSVTVEDGTHDFDIASHDGTNGLKLGGTLKTATAAKLNLLTSVSSLFTELSEDTSPQLGGDLDMNGNSITDASREFAIIGNDDNTTNLTANFDSFSNTNRVHGVTMIESQVGNSANRFHSNPILTFYQADAATVNSGSSAGRIRMNYVEGVYDMNGHNNSTSGFGKGFNAHFVSGMCKNEDPGNDSATLTDMTCATYTPQFKSGSSGGLTVTNCKSINMQPNINSGAVNITNLYGLFYDSINSGTGTVTNEFSFYGNSTDAIAFNAGGFQPGGFSAASLASVNAPVGTIVAVTDAAGRTNGTNNNQPAYTTGSGNWFYVSNDLAV